MAAAFTIFILLSIQAGYGHGDAQHKQECSKAPPMAFKEGGAVVNPNLDLGLKGWKAYGKATIELRRSGGNNYIVATHRTRSTDSVSQKFSNLKTDRSYLLSAWIRVSKGSARVTPVMTTVSGSSLFLGQTGEARSGCWTELRSDFSFDASEPLLLYFESMNLEVEIWADSVSLVDNGPGQPR